MMRYKLFVVPSHVSCAGAAAIVCFNQQVWNGSRAGGAEIARLGNVGLMHQKS